MLSTKMDARNKACGTIILQCAMKIRERHVESGLKNKCYKRVHTIKAVKNIAEWLSQLPENLWKNVQVVSFNGSAVFSKTKFCYKVCMFKYFSWRKTCFLCPFLPRNWNELSWRSQVVCYNVTQNNPLTLIISLPTTFPIILMQSHALQYYCQ